MKERWILDLHTILITKMLLIDLDIGCFRAIQLHFVSLGFNTKVLEVGKCIPKKYLVFVEHQCFSFNSTFNSMMCAYM